MDYRKGYRPEIGVSVIERWCAYKSFEGIRNDIIQTVGEVTELHDGIAQVSRYGIHWRPRYDQDDIVWHDKFPANDAAEHFRATNIPPMLWNELYGKAIALFRKQQVVSSLEKKVRVQPEKDGSIRVSFVYGREKALVFFFKRDEDGNIYRMKMVDGSLLRNTQARDGMPNIKKTSRAAFDKAKEYFDQIPLGRPGPQQKLF